MGQRRGLQLTAPLFSVMPARQIVAGCIGG
jgi:hypothetical protein